MSDSSPNDGTTSVAQTTSGEDGASPAVQVTLTPAATSENLLPPLSPGSEEIEGAGASPDGLLH